MYVEPGPENQLSAVAARWPWPPALRLLQRQCRPRTGVLAASPHRRASDPVALHACACPLRSRHRPIATAL